MEWVYIGLLAGSLVTSYHPTREACEGRRVVLAEQKVIGKCVEAPRPSISTYSGTTMLSVCRPDGVCPLEVR